MARGGGSLQCASASGGGIATTWWWSGGGRRALALPCPLRGTPARLPGGPGRGSGVGAPPVRDAEKRMQNGQRFDLGTCFDSAHCSRHRSPQHETPALMPPASARKASASRHRPASGFCKHWRASTAPGRARAATAGTFRRRVTFCCGPGAHSRTRRRWLRGLTRCFAAPNPWTTDLPKPILAACMQGGSPPPRLSVRVAPRCASACARSSPVCRCPVSLSVCWRHTVQA